MSISTQPKSAIVSQAYTSLLKQSKAGPATVSGRQPTQPPAERFELSNPDLVPTLVQAANSSKVERCSNPKGMQISALETGLKISGAALLGVEGAALTFFAAKGEGTAVLKDGEKSVAIPSKQVQHHKDAPETNRYLLNLPDGTELEVMEVGKGGNLFVNRFDELHVNAYGTSFAPQDGSDAYQLTAARLTADWNKHVILDTSNGTLAQLELSENKKSGDTVINRSSGKNGVFTTISTPEGSHDVPTDQALGGYELALMADEVMQKTKIFTAAYRP